MRLITFPGQGKPVAVPVLQELISSKSKQFQKIVSADPTTEKLLSYITENPSSPGSIAVCSNIFYRLFEALCDEQSTGSPSTRATPHILLGHSLGELTCLSVNKLFRPTDLLNIANYRNDLMIKYTEEYCKTHKFSSKFEMHAVTSPSSSPTTLSTVLTNLVDSLKPTAPTLNIANINSSKQCVITAQPNDIDKLKTKINSLPNNGGRLRITKLSNPYGIPFHNNEILKPVQEPLYDYIWDTLRENNTHTKLKLDYPIISNLDGTLTSEVHTAIEKFVQCTSNTVQFTKCCDTVCHHVIAETDPIGRNTSDEGSVGSSDSIAVCMGPGEVIYGLLKRNCKVMKCYPYSSLDSVNKFHQQFQTI